MTQPPPSARDVAKHIDRRRMRRKATLWSALLATIALAVGYLRCGTGFGLGGGGKGDGPGEGSVATAPGPQRCSIRVAAAGITVGGKPMTRGDAAAACKAATGADVIVTGDAREGDWKDLYESLVSAGVKDIVVRHPVGPGAGSGSN
jgi:hypothetical protein